MDRKNTTWILSRNQMIVLSFFAVILLGAVLLTLPFAAADGRSTPFIDALFTATTSVCVTGLVTVTTATHWSLFGKIIILCLIQIGGLGVITMMTMLYMVMGKRISLGDRKLVGDSLSMDSLSGVLGFLRKVFLGTVCVELVGMILYLPVFIKDYGLIKGIWFSLFHSVSAFCNAGIDLIGDSSFMPYVQNPWINFVTILLIVLGGLGFLVWWDLIYVVGGRKHHLSLHTKIVLTMTAGLIVLGMLLYLVFEYDNPATIGGFSLGGKLLASLFQSVTTRTAGFAMISQKGLTSQSVVVSVILMLIGGSPAGTAGGIKTVTIAVLFISVLSTLKGRREAIAFGRAISYQTVRKALAVVSVSLIASLIALLLMFLCCDGAASDIIYEVYSAIGTAGLSRDFTGSMNLAGKIIICICMFMGRIGPMSLATALTIQSHDDSIHYYEEEVTVG